MRNFDAALEDGSFAVEPRKMYLDQPAMQAKLGRTYPLAFKMLPVARDQQKTLDETAQYTFHINDNTLLSGPLEIHPIGNM